MLWRYLRDLCSAVLGAKKDHQLPVIQLDQGRQLSSEPASTVCSSETLVSPPLGMNMVSAAVYAPETLSEDPFDPVEAAGIGGKGFAVHFW